ncbi:MAG: glycoside hydrolase [Ruminococcus sp.]|nr:glycoside hydrolase [Ruminococcus sp.]
MHSKFFKQIGASVMATAMLVSSLAVLNVGTAFAEGGKKYEFENAEISGDVTVEKKDSASGGSYLKMTNSGTIKLTFDVEKDGMYTLKVYAGGEGGAKQQNLAVNGASQGEIAIPESKGFEEISIPSIKLTAGENTLEISKSWGWSNFDYMTVEEAVLAPIKATQTTPVDVNATSETKSLMAYFADIYGNHILSGQQEIYSGGPHGLEQEFEYLKELTGHYPAIRGFDYGNFCCPAYGSKDGSTERIIDWVKNKNGIATASFHLNVPTDMSSYNTGDKIDWGQTTYSEKTDFSPSKAIVEGTKENLYYMEALTTLATEFKKLQAEGIPVIWRPLHEAEGGGGEKGSWFWWGREGSKVYKDLWIFTYKTITEELGCHNLIWEWNSYNFDTSADWYPGDDYVDIIGYDKYNCTEYIEAEPNKWVPSLVHNDSAISSTFYSIMEKYNSAKMVAMAENDCFSTVGNLTSEKAGWLYFCTWYDGGSDDINFLTNPMFNTEEDTIEMYQSDYCITLDELPENLYKHGDDIVITTKTTESDDKNTTTTTTTTTNSDDDFKFEVKSYDIELPKGFRQSVTIEIEGAPNASIGGALGYSTGDTPDDWVNIEWKGNTDADGKLTVTVKATRIPESVTNAQVQIWWSNVWDSATETSTDKDCEMVNYKVNFPGLGDVILPTLYGDADEDGKVNINDAVLIMQSNANPDRYSLTEQGRANADVVDGDGVTNSDALAIQYVESRTISYLDFPITSAELDKLSAE